MHGDNHLPLNGVLFHHSMLFLRRFSGTNLIKKIAGSAFIRDRRSWGERHLWGSGYHDWVGNFPSMRTLLNDWVECIRSILSSCVEAWADLDL